MAVPFRGGSNKHLHPRAFAGIDIGSDPDDYSIFGHEEALAWLLQDADGSLGCLAMILTDKMQLKHQLKRCILRMLAFCWTTEGRPAPLPLLVPRQS